MYGACSVHKEQNITWGRCLFGACTVVKEQKLTWGRCLYGACSVPIIQKKNEQRTIILTMACNGKSRKPDAQHPKKQ